MHDCSLPPSFLNSLAEKDVLSMNQARGQPLFFRLGIRREKYDFPSSVSMKKRMEQVNIHSDLDNNRLDLENNEDVTNHMHEDSAFEENEKIEEEEQGLNTEDYLDELANEYVSYTHAAVVEFTEEEGFIGLPINVASVLLARRLSPETGGIRTVESDINQQKVQSRLTSDPALVSSDTQIPSTGKVSTSDETKELDKISDEEEKTPGHPAYGAFPVPADHIHVTLLTNLPLGIKCTLAPTPDAIINGFYELKNIKLVLEQSLTRTRATLGVGDTVHTWFRGKKFDLRVKDVTPADFGVVSCVNTDVEVDIAPVEDSGEKKEKEEIKRNIQNGTVSESNCTPTLNNISKVGKHDKETKSLPFSSSGYRLSDTIESLPLSSNIEKVESVRKEYLLPLEPPVTQTQNVVSVQIRGDRNSQRRRFDINATKVLHLFEFAISESVITNVDNNNNDDRATNEAVCFQLVTRFPRRVLDWQKDREKSLQDVGLGKQELFMVEKL